VPENLDKWTTGEGFSASERRILLTTWLAGAVKAVNQTFKFKKVSIFRTLENWFIGVCKDFLVFCRSSRTAVSP
jgi:hypothetical protein